MRAQTPHKYLNADRTLESNEAGKADQPRAPVRTIYVEAIGTRGSATFVARVDRPARCKVFWTYVS
jgi:hypothetical protein